MRLLRQLHRVHKHGQMKALRYHGHHKINTSQDKEEISRKNEMHWVRCELNECRGCNADGELTLQMAGKDHFPPAHPCLSWRLPVQTVASRTGWTGRPTIYLIKQNFSTRRMTTQDIITITSKLGSIITNLCWAINCIVYRFYNRKNITNVAVHSIFHGIFTLNLANNVIRNMCAQMLFLESDLKFLPSFGSDDCEKRYEYTLHSYHFSKFHSCNQRISYWA